MISLEKWKILTPLQNLPRIVGDLGKLIAAKVQKIAKSGHTDSNTTKEKKIIIIWQITA